MTGKYVISLARLVFLKVLLGVTLCNLVAKYRPSGVTYWLGLNEEESCAEEENIRLLRELDTRVPNYRIYIPEDRNIYDHHVLSIIHALIDRFADCPCTIRSC